MTTITRRRQPDPEPRPSVPRHDQAPSTVLRPRPWHRILARILAARLDRQLAVGAIPEASALLTARTIYLTSPTVRRHLATTLHRLLATTLPAAALPELAAALAASAALPTRPGAAHPPRIPLNRARIRQAALPLGQLAIQLTQPGPVSAQGVAMITLLLADGTGPLYHDTRGDELADTLTQAMWALTR